MKNILVIFLILLSLGCGKSIRSVQKSAIVDNSIELLTDQSIMKTIKEADTTAWTKIDSASSNITAKEIADSKDSVIIEEVKSGSIILETSYNKNTKEFKAKAKKEAEAVSVKIKETTTTQNNIQTKINKDVKQTETVKHIEREGTVNWTKVLIWLGVILTFGILVYVMLTRATKF